MSEIGTILYIGLIILGIVLGIMWIMLPIWVHQMLGKLDRIHDALHLIGKEIEENHAIDVVARDKASTALSIISSDVAKLKTAAFMVHNLEEG